MGIDISKGAHAIGVSASITGKDRVVTVVSRDVNGDSETVEKSVSETVANKIRFDEATKLVNRARATLKKFGTMVEPLGFITDEYRAGLFRAEIAKVGQAITAHNAETGQEHIVSLLTMCLPIGLVLDESTQATLCQTVIAALDSVKVSILAGQIDEVSYWLTRKRNIPGLMPALISRAVQDAVDDVVRILAALRAEINDNHRDASVVGSEQDVSLIDTALAMALPK